MGTESTSLPFVEQEIWRNGRNGKSLLQRQSFYLLAVSMLFLAGSTSVSLNMTARVWAMRVHNLEREREREREF